MFASIKITPIRGTAQHIFQVSLRPQSFLIPAKKNAERFHSAFFSTIKCVCLIFHLLQFRCVEQRDGASFHLHQLFIFKIGKRADDGFGSCSCKVGKIFA